MAYNDNTILTFGEYKFTRLCRVPAFYLIDLYKSGCQDKELLEYVKENMDKIKDRLEGKSKTPQLVMPCTKFAYSDEKDAKRHLKEIHNKGDNHGYQPIRAYECNKCGFWHLTSKPFKPLK